MRILIVEDEPNNQEVAAVFLKTGRHDVEVAPHGEDALARMHRRSEVYDLVVMDLLMPVLAGIRTTRMLRANELTTTVPIPTCSAKAGQHDGEEALAAGVHHFVAKPFRRSALLDAVAETLLQRSHGS